MINTNIRKFGLALFLIIAALAGWCLLNASSKNPPRSREPASTPIAERPLTDYRFGRPRVLAERPADHEVANFRTLIETAIADVRVTPRMRLELTDTLALAKIRAAQSVIEGVPDVPGAWNWYAVQEVIRGIGTTYPAFEFMPDERYDLRLGRYEQYSRSFIFNAVQIGRISVAEVAQNLVHEATHTVFAHRLDRESGFSRDEQAWLEMRCSELRSPFRILNEGLAWSNEAIWHKLRHQGRISPSAHPDLDRMLREASDATMNVPGAIDRFAQELVAYSEHVERNTRDRHPERDRRCLPLVALRGPHAGEWFSPADINPSFALPLFRAAFGP